MVWEDKCELALPSPTRTDELSHLLFPVFLPLPVLATVDKIYRLFHHSPTQLILLFTSRGSWPDCFKFSFPSNSSSDPPDSCHQHFFIQTVALRCLGTDNC
jgi:hypothetical protein